MFVTSCSPRQTGRANGDHASDKHSPPQVQMFFLLSLALSNANRVLRQTCIAAPKGAPDSRTVSIIPRTVRVQLLAKGNPERRDPKAVAFQLQAPAFQTILKLKSIAFQEELCQKLRYRSCAFSAGAGRLAGIAFLSGEATRVRVRAR